MNKRFEWDSQKAASNWRDHGVTFGQAIKALSDPFGIEWIDDREDYDEERVNTLGRCDGVILHITHTERSERIRIISAGGRNDMNKTTTIARMRPDGTVVEVLDDGEERPLLLTAMRPMSEAEIEAAAAADPDARPMTTEQMQAARRVPRIKTLRRALALTQEEFATRYHIPIGTLRDWEQGRTEPDQPARAYLTVIARDPDGVRRALDRQPEPI